MTEPYIVKHEPRAFLRGGSGWTVIYGATGAYAAGPWANIGTAAAEAVRLNAAAPR
jgi:hypothetical protein